MNVMIAIPLWLAALLTSLLSGLLQVLWHYLPVLGIQQLRAPSTYIIGVLTALLPATGCAILAAQGPVADDGHRVAFLPGERPDRGAVLRPGRATGGQDCAAGAGRAEGDARWPHGLTPRQSRM